MFRKKPIRINTYLGYGTHKRLRAMGRALEVENIDFNGNTSIFRTLWNIFKQFESDKVTHAGIELHLSNGNNTMTSTNSQGYYYFDKEFTKDTIETSPSNWISYTVSYHGKQKKEIINDNVFKGEMLIPSKDAEYGIISDIDDTILHTGVASLFKWRVITNTFFKNFDKRLPLEGTVNFYKKLQSGKNSLAINPIFYVSNSPWNLYDYLSAFLKKNNFPKGPVLLRDFRRPFDKIPKPKKQHKQTEILNLLNLYPHLRFVLIGDSGEKDADIYTKIALEYPDRILAIYLRNIHKRKEKRIFKIINYFKTTPILLFKTSKEAEEHARKCDLIN
ncbi:DUF2183 domain-containing protein [Aquimarina addita]|uniref:DUF2183 domain-containing protein n=1 Tax=Aquimarina addita TaxID=870485 RepID=A0ABP6URR0_9FLAO